MATTQAKFNLKGKNRDRYLELVLAFPLASIKSEEHLEAAQAGHGSTACPRGTRRRRGNVSRRPQRPRGGL